LHFPKNLKNKNAKKQHVYFPYFLNSKPLTSTLKVTSEMNNGASKKHPAVDD
jgi:hypothetical protein